MGMNTLQREEAKSAATASHDGINHAEKLYEFLDHHRRMPTYRELVHVWNYKTKSAVDYRVRKLLAAGLVGKEGGRLIAKRSGG